MLQISVHQLGKPHSSSGAEPLHHGPHLVPQPGGLLGPESNSKQSRGRAGVLSVPRSRGLRGATPDPSGRLTSPGKAQGGFLPKQPAGQQGWRPPASGSAHSPQLNFQGPTPSQSMPRVKRSRPDVRAWPCPDGGLVHWLLVAPCAWCQPEAQPALPTPAVCCAQQLPRRRPWAISVSLPWGHSCLQILRVARAHTQHKLCPHRGLATTPCPPSARPPLGVS